MRVDPDVAKAGAIQSQGAKGAAVVTYCNYGVDTIPSSIIIGPRYWQNQYYWGLLAVA